MGHAKEIHKNIYRVPVPVREMTDVSRLLEAAMGNDLNENDNEDCNDNNKSDTDSMSHLSIISEKIAQRNSYMPDSDNSIYENTQDSSINNDTNNSHSEDSSEFSFIY